MAADTEGLTGDGLLDFINNKLFPSLKGLSPEALSNTVVADYGFSPGSNSRFQIVVDIQGIYIDLRYGKPRSRNGQIILFNPEIKKWCVTNVS